MNNRSTTARNSAKAAFAGMAIGFVAFLISWVVLTSTGVIAGTQNAYADGDPGAGTKTIYTLEYYTGELASSYTSADVSSVKNQGAHGDCWSFSTLGTLESTLHKMGLVNDESLDGYYDFSEQALAWALYEKHCNTCGSCDIAYDSATGTYYCANCESTEISFVLPDAEYNSLNKAGGNQVLALWYLGTQNGILCDEESWPFNTMFPSMPEPESLETYDIEVESVVAAGTLEDLKRMIVSYGAVSVSFFVPSRDIGMSTWDDGNGNTYLTMCGENLPNEGGHAVIAIGWDDTFSRTNFTIDRSAIIAQLQSSGQYGATNEFNELLETLDIPTRSDDYADMADPNYVQNAIDYINGLSDDELFDKYGPKTDGAILVKNSWGTSSKCSTGYVWLPYDQLDTMALIERGAFAVDAVSVNDTATKTYTHIDWAASTAYMLGSEVVANIFDFEENATIDSISVAYEVFEDTECDVYYAPVSEGAIVTSGMQYLGSCVLSSSKIFETIELDNAIVVPAKTGAIIVAVDDRTKIYWAGEGSNGSSLGVAHAGETCIYDGEQAAFLTLGTAIGTNLNVFIDVNTQPSAEQPLVIAADYSAYTQLANSIEASTVLKKELYTSESWLNYLNAKSAFDAVPQDLDAWSQIEVNEAVANLQAAIEALVLLDDADYAEYFALSATLADLSLAEADYDSVSWKLYLQARKAFENVPEGLKSDDQSRIDAAVDALERALRGLVPADKTSENVKALQDTFNKRVDELMEAHKAELAEQAKAAGEAAEAQMNAYKADIAALLAGQKSDVESMNAAFAKQLQAAQDAYSEALEAAQKAYLAQQEKMQKEYINALDKSSSAFDERLNALESMVESLGLSMDKMMIIVCALSGVIVIAFVAMAVVGARKK